MARIDGSFQAFNQIYTMNRAASQPPGGPLGSTTTVSIYMFNELYNKQRAGYATSVSVLLSLIIMTFTLIQFKYFNRREVE
jgi:multiple sugar transport system permease protein